jgi:glycosyltransferase involved in cell wall biosynthesis
MKILYVVTGAEYGGAVAHVLGLVRADLRQGYVVGLVASPEKRLLTEIQNSGVQFFPDRYFIRRVKLVNDLRSLWPLIRAIRKFQPDIVSAHSTKAGLAARLACLVLRKPVVFTAHGWAFSAGQSTLKRRLLPAIEHLAAIFTRRIICVSRYDLDLALRYRIAPASKMTVVHNGIDATQFLNIDGRRIRREFDLRDRPVLIMVARLTPQKDPLTLLAACQILQSDFRCLIVGDGELRNAAEQFVKQNGLQNKIIFTGERQDIPSLLAASSIFVLATHWEGLPLTLIEAGLAGLPAVASRVGGVPEIVQDGVTGFTVPPDDPAFLAATIKNLLDDPVLRQRIGHTAREINLRDFTFERMLADTRQVYRSVLMKQN